MSREDNLVEDSGWVGRIRGYIKEEPARAVEHLRSILLALTAWGLVTLDDVRMQGILAAASIITSIIAQNKGVRNVVTPYWKVDGGKVEVGVSAEVPMVKPEDDVL